jgi:hypothetical protein
MILKQLSLLNTNSALNNSLVVSLLQMIKNSII